MNRHKGLIEMYKRDVNISKENQNVNTSKETYKRDILQRRHKYIKRDLEKRPTKKTFVKRDVNISKETWKRDLRQ